MSIRPESMQPRIRIAKLIYGFGVEGPGGGLTRFACALAKALNHELFEVSLYGLWDFGTPQERDRVKALKAQGITTEALADWQDGSPYLNWWRAHAKLGAILRHSPADVVHSHSEFADISALALRLFHGQSKVMRTVHYGYRVEWRNKPLRRYLLTYLLYPLAFSLEIGVSDSITANLNRRYLARLQRKPALMVPNAIDLSRFEQIPSDKGYTHESLGLPAGVRLVGSVGRLTEQKGLDVLVRAAARVVGEVADVHFLIIGEGEQAPDLARLVTELGVADRLHLTGSRSDVERILPCLEIFVSSSRWEGLPTVVMEAMASGTPVVATDIPGNRDLIEPGASGWLAPPEDPDRLAEAILLALAQPEERARFARKGRERVRAHSIQAVARTYEKLYSELISV